jgi:hypothetical protein
MSDYMKILRPQVERTKAMIDSPDLDHEDKVLLRGCCETSIECAHQREEITRQQRDELMRLLQPAEASKGIRLACMYCDRQDFDGISEQSLQDAIAGGWEYVDQVQSQAEAAQTHPIGKEPPGFSVFDWWTHLGICPDCRKDGM